MVEQVERQESSRFQPHFKFAIWPFPGLPSRSILRDCPATIAAGQGRGSEPSGKREKPWPGPCSPCSKAAELGGAEQPFATGAVRGDFLRTIWTSSKGNFPISDFHTCSFLKSNHLRRHPQPRSSLSPLPKKDGRQTLPQPEPHRGALSEAQTLPGGTADQHLRSGPPDALTHSSF